MPTFDVTLCAGSHPDSVPHGLTSHHVVEAATPLEAAYRAELEAIAQHSGEGWDDWFVDRPPLEVTRPCRFCGAQVTSSKPEVNFCEMCFYAGDAFSDQYAGLIDELGEKLGTDGGVWHTGGGCFALGGTWPDGSFWMATDGNAGLPDDPEGPWMVGFFPDEEHEGFYSGGDALEAHLLGGQAVADAISQLRASFS